MQFMLVGFRHDAGFRIFAFTGVAADRSRMDFTVGVDLALIPRYGIRVQELPLLCRGLLERHGEGPEKRTLTFTEEEMRLYSNECTAAREAAAQRRKQPRRPPAPQLGAAWRGPQGL